MLLKLILLSAAASLAGPAQPAADDYEVLSESEGWSVVRRPDGCFAVSTFEGSGEPTFTIFYNAEQSDSPLALLFSNSDWRLEDELVEDYRLDLPGSSHQWSGLHGTSMSGEGEEEVALIGISFAADAVDAMLSDIATAGGAELFRGDTSLIAYRLSGNAAAVRGLISCLRSFPRLTLPALPQADAATATR